jgi:hypothetical protein
MSYLKKAEETILNNLNHFHPQSFNIECDLFYKGQIPTGAIFITEGKVCQIKRNKVQVPLKLNQLIFLEELLNESPVKNNIRVYPGTKLYLIDRFSVMHELEGLTIGA